MEYSGGWDSSATLVDGWVERRPRRPEVSAQLLRETVLMPWLAPRLPLRVPIPVVLSETPLVVRHALVSGDQIVAPSSEHGRAVGEFLEALHRSPVADAVAHGLLPAAHTKRDRLRNTDRLRVDVLPLIPVELREKAVAVLDAIADFPADTVVHGDLGPEHVLVDGDRVTGVIDFGDTHIGDAAVDLAWCLFDTPVEFAEAVGVAYGVTDALRERALVWHRLGPWYEVTYGLDIGDMAIARSGLEGLVDRLGP
ncbi:phosphotransferase [Nocardia sp. NPDC051030]|uniref:phosphotransferase n=1 Tax=Nocardia sp. NPDC051030 TaxID=3155162 RepID=UPI0034309CAE